MAKQTISQLRAWFSRFKKPTEGQFWDLFDSFFHKDENIPASKVEGLGTIVQEQNEAIDSSLTASSQAIELANQAIQGDLFKKPAEQTSSYSPDNQTAVAHISLADFMNDSNMYDNVQAVGDIWRPRVIFPQYSNAGGSLTLRFWLNRIVPSAKLQLLDRCVITSNISDSVRDELSYPMSEIIKSARIRKSVNVEGQTAFLIFKDYTETTRLHDRLYMPKFSDVFQNEKLRGTYDADVDSYHNLELPGWYLIGKTYASMGGITGGAVSYNNASHITPGQFSFYAPTSVGTNVYDSIFGVPNSYVEAIWISDNGDGNYYLNVTWRHIKHLSNESWTMLAINSINIYLPKL